MGPDKYCSVHDAKFCVVFGNVYILCNCCEGNSFENGLEHQGQLHRLFVMVMTDEIF